MEVEEADEPNLHWEQNIPEAESRASSDYMVNCVPCCFDRVNTDGSKDHPGATPTALQIVDLISFNNQMLRQTEEKDQVLVQPEKLLLGEGERWNPEGKLEATLEMSKTLANDKNTMSDEKKDMHVAFSEHNICPEPTKGNNLTASKLKESVFKILKEIYASTSESSIANLYVQQMMRAFYMWISENEGSVLFKDCTKDHLRMEKTVSDFTKVSVSNAIVYFNFRFYVH